MSFSQPYFLAILGALAVPIIIHLLFRRRSRKVNLGTLRFLRVVLEENAKRRKLKRWLLLSLRLACVALLAGVFARPYLIAREAATRDRFVAILIDRSASMQLKEGGQRLLDHAVEQAKDLVRRADESTRIELAFFDHGVHPVTAAGTKESEGKAIGADRGQVLTSLAAPEAAWSSTNYGSALAWARDVSLAAPYRRKELHIFTDMQRSGLDWTGAEPLPSDIDVHLIDLGRPTVHNVAVTAAQPARTIIRPGDGASIAVSVSNGAPFPLEKTPLVLTLEQGERKHVLREKISLEPGGTGSVTFEVPSLAAGLWRGVARLEWDDDLNYDNQRYLAILSTPQIPVLLIDGDRGATPLQADTYFLEAALRLAPPGKTFADSPFAPEVVAVNGTWPELNRYRVVVLANPPPLARRDVDRLAKFVREGGHLLVFTGEQVRPEGVASLKAAGLSVGEVGGIARAHELPFRLQEWDETHPLFEPFNDPQHGDLRRLAFSACTRIEPESGSRVIASFRGGHPALIEKTLDKGEVLWCTVAADSEWSSWTRSRLYVPWIHQIVGHLSGLTGGGPVRDFLLDASSRRGLDETPGIHEHDRFVAVVNPSPRESETERCTHEDFANRFQLSLHRDQESETTSSPVQAAATTASDLRDDEIWHWILLALVALLLTEGFLANRTAA